MPLESARAPFGDTPLAHTASRICVVCGGDIPLTRRGDAKHCTAACRARGSRERRAIDPGPPLSEVIATRRHALEATATGVSTLRTFDNLARALTPLAHRPVAAITEAEWREWFTTATANFRESTRTLWARMLKTMLKGVPHWFGAVVPSTPQAPTSPPPALPRRRSARLDRLPRTERTRLMVALLRKGFLPVEIRGFRLDVTGEVLPGTPAWGRHDMPSLPPTLRDRLRVYARSRGLAPGDRLFPVSGTAIYAAVRRAGAKRGLTVSCSALAQSARRR